MFSSKEVVQQNALEREFFRQRALLLRRELQTCKESLSLKHRQFLAEKSKLLECKNSSDEQKTMSSSSSYGVEQHSSGECIDTIPKCSKTCICNAVRPACTSGATCGCEGMNARGENSGRSIAEESMRAFISLESVTDDTMNLLKGPAKKQRPKSKKFSSAVPQVESSYASPPVQPYCKPKSPTKRIADVRANSSRASRSRRPLPGHGHHVRIEPGLHLDPSQSIEISKFRPQHGMESSCSSEKFMDSTQRKIKAFLDKTCADAVRSRSTIRPAVSISDLGTVDEQQMSMPILVDGVLGPEERKRQVSMVYPMRTPSPRPTAPHPHGTGDSSTNTYRTPRSEFRNKPSSPLNLPPILLPPVRENQKFQPRQSSWMRPSENRMNKPISEEEWRSLRKCRYLRIPESHGMRFNLMDNIEHIFK